MHFVYQQLLLAPLLLLAEESGIPLFIPGEVVITYIGYQASRGRISYIAAFVILLACVLVGSSILYFISKKYGQFLVLKVGKYIHLNEKRLNEAEKSFKKYGVAAIIFGRHIPGFRIPITVFTGMSEISYKKFIISTFISVVFWIPAYMYVGATLGPKALHNLRVYHSYYPFIVLAFVLGLVIYLFRKKIIKMSSS